MDPIIQGILFLVAVGCFLLAALPRAAWAGPNSRVNLVALGLAFGFFVFMWNAFDAA